MARTALAPVGFISMCVFWTRLSLNFHEELSDEIRCHEGQLDWDMVNPRQKELAHSPIARRETLELVRAYYGMENPAVRQCLFELNKILAKTAD